jgi:hypothetical protein
MNVAVITAGEDLATRNLDVDPIAVIRAVEEAARVGLIPPFDYEWQDDRTIGQVRAVLAAAREVGLPAAPIRR